MRLLFFLAFFSLPLVAQLEISPEQIEQSLKTHITYSEEGPNPIGHIYIGGHDSQISQGTYLYVKNALDYFRDEVKPIFIILELDTPGGQVFAAQKISDALKEMDIQYDIPIVTVINNWAISAGAMLAYSSRYIATVKDGSMGAAAPVSQQGEATSEKVNSAIRTDFANRAAFFDRNPLIAEAMVDADLTLVIRGNEVVKLPDNEAILPSDLVISKEGKLLTLSAKQMIDWGVADFSLLPEKLVPITADEKEAGKWAASKELLFTLPFFKAIPNAQVTSFKMDWKTKFFSFLGSPVVTSLLFLGLMIGFYMEVSTPGFGLPGIVGIVCLGLILMSSFSLQAASWFEFILLGVGVGMILVEIFLIPGFGFIGVIGIILAIAGLFGILLPGLKEVSFDFDTQTLNAAGEFLLHRLAWLSGTLVVGVVVIAVLAKYFVPRFGFLSPLVLKGEQVGYVSGPSRDTLPDLGAQGEVLSPLRPAGKVEISGEVYDAVSSGNFLEKGQRVKVIDVEGSKIVVEEEA